MSHLDDIEAKAFEEAAAKRLLSRKRGISGAEAGWLYILDSREYDHGRIGILRPNEMSDLKNRLSTQADIQEYNRLVECYRTASFTLNEARAEAFRLERDIYAGTVALLSYLVGVAEPPVIERDQDGDEKLMDQSGPHFVSSPGLNAAVAAFRFVSDGETPFSDADMDAEAVSSLLRSRYRQHTRNIRSRLRRWLAYLEAMEMLSVHLRVKLTEDLEDCYESIRLTVGHTNRLLARLAEQRSRLQLPHGLELKPLRIDDLKPYQWMVRHLRERMAMTLGGDWWLDTLRDIDHLLARLDAQEEALEHRATTEPEEKPDEPQA